MKKKKTSAAKAERQVESKASVGSGAQPKRTSAREDKGHPDLLYLYGISAQRPPLESREGVDGRAPVEAIECEGLVCWISRVSAHEFGDELQTRMENLDWLAGASVRHQRVVAAIHEKCTVLPARFATLFFSDESLNSDVKRRIRKLREDLKRVEGADEYGVKIFAAPRAAAAVSDIDSGRDYLKRKSQLLRQPNTPAITPEVEKFVAELRGMAGESVVGGSVSGGQKNLAWQGSLLVARSARPRLESLLAQFRRRHPDAFRIECTGPWPPYSFIAVKADAR